VERSSNQPGSSGSPDVDFGRLGSSATIAFWNAMLGATSSVMQRHLLRGAEIFQRVFMGEYGAAQWASDVTQLWSSWFGLAAFPFEWWSRYMGHIPTLILVVDKTSGTVGPVSAPTPISLSNRDFLLNVTDLQHLQGKGRIESARHVFARLTQNGNRLEAKLVELGDSPEERERTGIQPGFYIGLVYASLKAESQRLPLAILAALVEESAPGPAETLT
jgi:hypothetical protein